MKFRNFALRCTAVSTLALWPVAGFADVIDLRIGAGHPASSTHISTVVDFFIATVSERVEAETEHSIRWTEAWGGSVCTLGNCLEAVEDGLLDIAEVQSVFEPSNMMAHNFSYFVPFGAGNAAQAANLSRLVYNEVPELKQMLEDQYRQKFIGVGIVGNYGIVTTYTWDTLDELEGQRIAAAGANIPWVQAVGMVPVQSNLNEAYTAMQTGVYDGWVMYPDGVTAFRLDEVTAQFTVTDFGAIATPVLTINLDTWNSLPEEVQTILLEVGNEWTDVVGEYTESLHETSLQAMRDRGLTVKILTDEEKAEWASRLPNIPLDRSREIDAAGGPGEAVYSYIDALAAEGHVFPRDWAAERE